MTAPHEPVSDVGPGRAFRRVVAQARKLALRVRLGERWETSADGFKRRVYPSYELYLRHQKTKFDAARGTSVRGHDERFYSALAQRLHSLPLDLRGRSVLCIGARQGTEVRAFIDAGAFAIGLDLNAGRGNRYVVTGDFHALQYGDSSVAIVYTNSLDHAFELDRVIAEVHRVLITDGLLIAELNAGDESAADLGFYESTGWESVDRILARITAHGFTLVQRSSFAVPWSGDQILLRKVQPAVLSKFFP